MTKAINYRRPRGTSFARASRWKGHTVHLFDETRALYTLCREPVLSTYVNLRRPICAHCAALVREKPIGKAVQPTHATKPRGGDRAG